MTKAEERALEEYPVYKHSSIDINRRDRAIFFQGYEQAEKDILEVSDMKSPFTGGKVLRGMEKKTITFRGEEYTVPQRFFKCQDSGKEFTDAALDDDNIWEVIKAYFIRKGVSPFDLVALTIEDIELLHTFLYAIKNNKHGCFTFTRLSDEQYQEVLRRFNESKK